MDLCNQASDRLAAYIGLKQSPRLGEKGKKHGLHMTVHSQAQVSGIFKQDGNDLRSRRHPVRDEITTIDIVANYCLPIMDSAAGLPSCHKPWNARIAMCKKYHQMLLFKGIESWTFRRIAGVVTPLFRIYVNCHTGLP